MTLLWISIALLLLLAFVFIFWPMLKYRNSVSILTQAQIDDRVNENVRLFHEHLAELDVQKADGRLDDAQYAQLRLEQERALLEDEQVLRRASNPVRSAWGRMAFPIIAIVLTAGAISLYQYLGSGKDVEIQELQLTKQYHDYQDMLANRESDPQRAKELAASIESRLESDQENIQYWFLLARTYMGLNDFAKAANAYQQVVNRDNKSGMVLAEAAQAMFLRDGNRLSPPVEDLTKAALALEPENTMALGLMGIISFNHKNYLEAIQHWEKAIAIIGPDSSSTEPLNVGIQRAKTLYLESGGSEEALGPKATGHQLSVSVSLGQGIKANPENLVYVYARAWKGPKMPLAITRIKVADLPKTLVLTEAMAMSPAMTLAQATEVELVARISQDGTATAKPGDWQGTLGPVDMKAVPGQMSIIINQEVKP